MLWCITYQNIRNMALQNYPSWVLKHKVQGTEIRLISGRYYLYQVKSYWDKESKRSKKVTELFLGRITEAGLVKGKRDKKTLSVPVSSFFSVQEYGIAHFLILDLFKYKKGLFNRNFKIM